MASIEEHKKTAETMLKEINEKIRTGLTDERQKIIGFAESEASTNMLAILLHKNNLIQPGFNINHRWFKSEKSANERFNYEFPDKKNLLPLMVKQEDFREKLCYGNQKPKKIVEDSLKNFFEIKKLIEKNLGEEI
ncbi:MAG: hypothetical protein ISS95_00975 [Candidatus Aenigmarchaeota archaeon]|nr:hypothetical protein [Candidatus Aenigmarchaeota archaeon]